VYVIGEASERAAIAAGFSLVTRFPHVSNAQTLAEELLKLPSNPLPFLVLVGDRRLPDLFRIFDAAGVAYKELEVYRTKLSSLSSLPAPSSSAASLPPAPAWAVFFSPSGVAAVRDSPLAGWPWEGIRRAALGPSTAQALREADAEEKSAASRWSPSAIAAAPNPSALLQAILQYEQQCQEPW